MAVFGYFWSVDAHAAANDLDTLQPRYAIIVVLDFTT
jgi:hypothetical protein